MMEGQRAELAHGVVFACGNHEIVGLGLLQDEPHALDVVAGITPVAQGVEVTQIELVLLTLGNTCGGERNLARHEGLAAALTLVVEQDAVAAIHAIRLAVVLHDPEAVELGHGIGRTRIERRGFRLRHFLHLAVELGGAGLIDATLVLQSADAYGLQQAEHAHGIGIGRVFRHIERNLHVALCGQVVDLGGLRLADDADERG